MEEVFVMVETIIYSNLEMSCCLPLNLMSCCYSTMSAVIIGGRKFML
jgi:hypothetical protein